jgi:general secretion pathway protein A
MAVKPTPAPALAPAASAAGVPPAASNTAPIFVSASDLSARFPDALRREADAWRELAPLWPSGGPAANAADPCVPTPPSFWQCFKSNGGGLSLIRQLDRPGILTLRDDAGRSVYALLLALDERSATLRIGAQRIVIALVSLANLWQGDFATYWQAPVGYQRVLGEGESGPLVDQLAIQLAALRGEAPPEGAQRFDVTLRSRLQAFQLAQGLKPDGLAGPTTYMQLTRASGPTNEPRLTVKR